MRSLILQNKLLKSPVGLNGFKFSKRIASKYGIFRKSGRLPALVFLRLFGVKAEIPYRELINKFIRFHFNIYFKVTRQLRKEQGNYQRFQQFYNIINYGNKLQSGISLLFTRNIQAPQNIIKEGEAQQLSFASEKLVPFIEPVMRAMGERDNFDRLVLISPLAGNDTLSQTFTGFPDSSTLPHSIQTGYINTARILSRNLNFIPAGGQQPQKISRFIAGIPLSYEPLTWNTVKIFNRNLKPTSAFKYSYMPSYLQLNVESKTPENTLLLQYISAIKNINYESISKEDKRIGGRTLFPGSYTRPAKIALNSINTAAIRNLQRTFNIENVISRFNRAVCFLRYGQERPLLDLSHKRAMGGTVAGNDTSLKKPDNKAVKDTSYDNIFKKGGDRRDILRAYLKTEQAKAVLSLINPLYISYLQKKLNIDSKFNRTTISSEHGLKPLEMDAVSKGSDTPLSQQDSSMKNTGYTISYRTIGRNILFPFSNRKVATLNSNTLITTRDFKRAFNTGNINLKSAKVFNSLHSGAWPSKEVIPYGSSTTGTISWRSMDRDIISERAGASLSQQNSTVKYVEVSKEFDKTSPQLPGRHPLNLEFSHMVEKTLTDKDRAYKMMDTPLNPEEDTGKNILVQVSKFNAKNIGLKLNKIIQPLLSRVQPLNTKRHYLELSSLKFDIMRIPGKTTDIIDTPSKHLSPTKAVQLQYADIRRESKPAGSKDLASDAIYSPGELILKIPVRQGTDISTANRENIQAEKINSATVNQNLTKGAFIENPAHEINVIADTVYKIIERKISIERDRRGLF